MEAWEAQIAAKLGDLGDVCSGAVTAGRTFGTVRACDGSVSIDSVSVGTNVKTGPVDGVPSGDTPNIGTALLAHLERAQRVRTSFQEAVACIQDCWAARLSRMRECLAARFARYASLPRCAPRVAFDSVLQTHICFFLGQ